VENVKKLLEDLSDDELESQLTVLKVTQQFFVYILPGFLSVSLSDNLKGLSREIGADLI
jgi:hypothetical protein